VIILVGTSSFSVSDEITIFLKSSHISNFDKLSISLFNFLEQCITVTTRKIVFSGGW
jgi:hypothetical protein